MPLLKNLFGHKLESFKKIANFCFSVRYNFTHEVLKNSASYFQNKHIDKGRRISVLSRSEPQLKQETEPSNTIFTSKVISLD